jgi:FkbM family methyltransferase
LPSGYRICVSPAEHLAYLIGTAETHLQRIIREYVSAGDTVYDIGANIGYVTLSLAKQVGTAGRVIAFEPVPQNIELLRENVAINRLANVEIIERAASDRSGAAVIRMSDNLAMASLVWHTDDSLAAEVAIHTVAIDECVQDKELLAPKFVKLDVEGAEGLALLGMRNTLAVAKPVLFVECSDAGRETAWQLLQDLGYGCQSAITRRAISNFEQYRHSDFLWVPSG